MSALDDLAARRLFTFGCSFTQYWRWPTWADALGRGRSRFENWGMSGAGNQFIFNSLIECHKRNHLGSGDDVVIMWTNTSREDRYHDGAWQPSGNVYWSDVAPAWSDRGYAIRDFAMIDASACLLTGWQVRWVFLSMVPLEQTNWQNDLGAQSHDQVHDVYKLYADTLSLIRPSVLQTVFNGHWRFQQPNWRLGEGLPDAHDPSRHDFHPTPSEHVRYIETVLPEMPIDHETKLWMRQCQQDVVDGSNPWHQPNLPRVRL